MRTRQATPDPSGRATTASTTDEPAAARDEWESGLVDECDAHHHVPPRSRHARSSRSVAAARALALFSTSAERPAFGRVWWPRSCRASLGRAHSAGALCPLCDRESRAFRFVCFCFILI